MHNFVHEGIWLVSLAVPRAVQVARAERPCHQMSEYDLAIPEIWMELSLSAPTCTWPDNRFHFLVTGGKETTIAHPSPSYCLTCTFRSPSEETRLNPDRFVWKWRTINNGLKIIIIIINHTVASKMYLTWNYTTQKTTEHFHPTSPSQNGWVSI